jgi:hypothetical protein
MADEKKTAKAVTKEPDLLVLNELPTQQIRQFIGDDGKSYVVKTRDEVLAENNEMLTKLMKLLG